MCPPRARIPRRPGRSISGNAFRSLCHARGRGGAGHWRHALGMPHLTTTATPKPKANPPPYRPAANAHQNAACIVCGIEHKAEHDMLELCSMW